MTAFGKDETFQADLLGYHLGLVEPDVRARVESGFDDAESLAAARAAVQAHLAALDAEATPVVPSGLAGRVMDRIERSRGIIPLPSRLPESPSDAAGSGGSLGAMFTIRELVGLAAVIALFAGVFVPGYRTARNNAQRVVCMNNLGVVGEALENYRQSYGVYPYAGDLPADGNWMVTGDALGHVPANNSRHIFQLVGDHYVSPNRLLCPERDAEDPVNWTGSADFKAFGGRNDYAFDFWSVSIRNGNSDSRRPLSGDMNPFVDAKRAPEDLRLNGNSLNHGRPGGQNVLRVDRSVDWTNTPRVGIDNDDIYRVADVKGEYTGLERPRSATDAFLIP